MDINIRIAGEAGQGVLTTGSLLVRAFAALGLHVLATRTYMSRIRGGLNWYDIRIGDRRLFAPAANVDLLVALNVVALEILRGETSDEGVILYNGPETDGTVAMDLDAVAKDAGGSKLHSNTVAAGAVFALLGYDVTQLESLLEKKFGKKGKEAASTNQACVRKGAELAAGESGKLSVPQATGRESPVYDGATAIGLSAAVSGVKFATAEISGLKADDQNVGTFRQLVAKKVDAMA